MLTKMTDADWITVLKVFEASRSRRGDKGRDDRKFLSALHYFVVHNITGIRSPGCARAACGHAATAPPSSVMTSRRLISLGPLRHLHHKSFASASSLRTDICVKSPYGSICTTLR